MPTKKEKASKQTSKEDTIPSAIVEGEAERVAAAAEEAVEQVAAEEVAKEASTVKIVTVKYLDGTIADGEYKGIRFVETLSCVVFLDHGLETFAPLDKLLWWTIGDQSHSVMYAAVRAQMREEAKAVLLEEVTNSEVEVEHEQEEEEEPSVPIDFSRGIIQPGEDINSRYKRRRNYQKGLAKIDNTKSIVRSNDDDDDDDF